MALILIVDDDGLAREGIRLRLQRLGHSVIEAENGSEAIKLFDQHAVDVVLTDIVMPEKDGMEMIRELLKANKRTRIIAMSAGGICSSQGYLEMARHMGASRVLAKPFSSDELSAVVEKVVRQIPGK